MSASDRREAGRALRAGVPRSSHAGWEPPSDRPDPVELLQHTSVGRLPELIPLRYGRMMRSPFAFFRGGAAIMARDLSTTPTTGARVQASGDCHLVNFGVYASAERDVVFGLNDFDETLPAPFEWDVKRLAASFVVAARDLGVDDARATTVVAATVAAYRRRLAEMAEMSPLDVWYDRIRLEDAIADAPDERARRARAKLAAKARSRIGEELVGKLVRVEGGRASIIDQPPLIYHHPDATLDVAHEFLANYRASLAEDRRVLTDRYEMVDVAVKVVGVGSVGTRCLIALLVDGNGHPLFLQVKEANASVLEPYAGASAVPHHGHRVVIGQHLAQPTSDIFLGWATGPNGRDFYVRQLRDMKLSVPLLADPVSLTRYGRYCAAALARAHANTGDASVISGYLGKGDTFDQAVASFAVAYADQNERDHALLIERIRDGAVDVIDELA